MCNETREDKDRIKAWSCWGLHDHATEDALWHDHAAILHEHAKVGYTLVVLRKDIEFVYDHAQYCMITLLSNKYLILIKIWF